ncbi:hypothetical protein HanPI659440_Chr12g0452701 [Helianthus annuus]|nr:hypothetical protein HanPI659440_Chr12g0452701 [Helianthus annuus]
MVTMIEKLNLVIKELIEEKDEEKEKEKERLNGIVAGLLAEKKKIRWIKMLYSIRCHKLKLC